MSHTEYITHLEELDRKDSRERARYIEYAEEANANHLGKKFEGQLSPTTEEWLKLRKLAN